MSWGKLISEAQQVWHAVLGFGKAADERFARAEMLVSGIKEAFNGH